MTKASSAVAVGLGRTSSRSWKYDERAETSAGLAVTGWKAEITVGLARKEYRIELRSFEL